MVRYIDNLDNIADEIKWLDSSYKHSEDELVKFVSCIIHCSFSFPFDYFWGTTDDDKIFEKLALFDEYSKNLAYEINADVENNI